MPRAVAPMLVYEIKLKTTLQVVSPSEDVRTVCLVSGWWNEQGDAVWCGVTSVRGTATPPPPQLGQSLIRSLHSNNNSNPLTDNTAHLCNINLNEASVNSLYSCKLVLL